MKRCQVVHPEREQDDVWRLLANQLLELLRRREGVEPRARFGVSLVVDTDRRE